MMSRFLIKYNCARAVCTDAMLSTSKRAHEELCAYPLAWHDINLWKATTLSVPFMNSINGLQLMHDMVDRFTCLRPSSSVLHLIDTNSGVAPARVHRQTATNIHCNWY